MTTLAWGQEQGPVSRSSAVVLADRVPQASFTDPDTTRNLQGPTTFVTFTGPGECFSAVKLAQHEYVRQPERMLKPTSQRLVDTLAPAVEQLGTMCDARFSVAAIPVRELENAFELSVVLGDSVRAAAALARWLDAPPTLAERGESPAATQARKLGQAISIYLDPQLTGPQQQADVQRAQILLARMAQLGSSVRRQVLEEEATLTKVKLAIGESAGTWSPASVVSTIDTLLRVLDAASSAERQTALYGMPDLLARLIRAQGFLDSHDVPIFVDSLRHASPAIAQFFGSAYSTTVLWFTQLEQHFAQTGTPVAPLVATFWYNIPKTSEPVTWPIPGRVSLLVLNGADAEQAALLRRVVAVYGPRGLVVTVVDKTNGFWLKGGASTGSMPATVEAVHDSAYYRDYLKIPMIPLAIVETPFLRQPDGHVIQREPVQYETAWVWGDGSWLGQSDMVLVDAAGHLLVDDHLSEARLDAYLARALGP